MVPAPFSTGRRASLALESTGLTLELRSPHWPSDLILILPPQFVFSIVSLVVEQRSMARGPIQISYDIRPSQLYCRQRGRERRTNSCLFSSDSELRARYFRKCVIEKEREGGFRVSVRLPIWLPGLPPLAQPSEPVVSIRRLLPVGHKDQHGRFLVSKRADMGLSEKFRGFWYNV